MNPFHIIYGRPPPSFIKYEPTSKEHSDIQELLLERDKIIARLQSNLQKAQHRMTVQANKKHNDLHFDVDDWVLVNLQPYRQHSLALRKNCKLGMRYFGPFQVI